MVPTGNVVIVTLSWLLQVTLSWLLERMTTIKVAEDRGLDKETHPLPALVKSSHELSGQTGPAGVVT